MNEATQEALKNGEVFSSDYVKTLREEAKANRLTAEGLQVDKTTLEKEKDATSGATETAVQAAMKVAKAEGDKRVALIEIGGLLKSAGVEIEPGLVYQDGIEPQKAFDAYVLKNKGLFKKDPITISGLDLGSGESAKILSTGKMSEIRNNPQARGMLSKIYSKLVTDDKQRSRRRPEA